MLTLPIQVGARYVRRDGVVVVACATSAPKICLVGNDPTDETHSVYVETGRVYWGMCYDMPFDLVANAPIEATGIEAQVCQDIAARQAVGIAKYGTTVAENPLALRAWMVHAYEECLDQAVYLRRAIDELDKSAL